MATLAEALVWEAGVYQIEVTDSVQGGASGTANTQAKQLANRTAWLKDALETHTHALTALQPGGAPVAGNVLTYDGTDLTWVTPASIAKAGGSVTVGAAGQITSNVPSGQRHILQVAGQERGALDGNALLQLTAAVGTRPALGLKSGTGALLSIEAETGFNNLLVKTGHASQWLIIDSNGWLYGSVDGQQRSGSTANRWHTVHSVNGVSTTSDRAQKVIQDELDPEEALETVRGAPAYRYTMLGMTEQHVGLMLDELPLWMHFGPDAINPYAVASTAWAAVQRLATRLQALDGLAA